MRLLVICSQYPPLDSPESLHTQMLCTRLAASGIEVHLLTSVLPSGAPEPDGFTLHPVMRSWSWGSIFSVLKVVRSVRPDSVLLIFLGWIYQFRPMVSFLPGLIRRFFPGIRFVTQFENAGGVRYTAGKHRLVGAVFRALSAGPGGWTPEYGNLLSASDAVITLSEIHRRELLLYCPGAAAKTVVIPVPPLLDLRMEDIPFARAEGRTQLGLAAGDDTVVIAYFGYIYPGKGVETLLRAMKRLKELRTSSCRKVRLIFIGGISEEQLKAPLQELCRSLGLTEADVTSLGHQADRQASTYLHASDIAVLPFDSGVRLNNSSFAACTIHGLPIVTTKSAKMEETFVHEDNVLLAEAKNPEAMAEALNRIIDDEMLANRLRAGSRRLSTECFSWDRPVRATLSVFRTSVFQETRKVELGAPYNNRS